MVSFDICQGLRFPFFVGRSYSGDKDLRSKLSTAKILHHSTLTKKELHSPIFIAAGELQPGV
jgi:hypothetical protein